ncbi:MAG: alpha/beta fold hydrolase [Beijerinckiaceae bacterium]
MSHAPAEKAAVNGKHLMHITLAVIAILVVVLAVWTQIAVARIASQHPPKGIFVPVTGGQLHLRDIGPRDAPPERTLVFLHGASSNHLALTSPLAERLQEGFRIIAIDRPGHGHSDRPGGRADASPSRQAALIDEALAALGVEKAILVAHSFAGAIATSYAMDIPERVAGLVLLGPATHPWPGGIAWYYHPASLPVIGPAFANLLPVAGAALSMEKALEGVFSPKPVPAGYIENTALRLTLRPASFLANAQDVSALLDHVRTRAGRYGAIKVPVTVISGDSDLTVSSVIHTAALGREIPQARIVMLKGVGHVPHESDPELVVAEINALSDRLLAQTH